MPEQSNESPWFPKVLLIVIVIILFRNFVLYNGNTTTIPPASSNSQEPTIITAQPAAPVYTPVENVPSRPTAIVSTPAPAAPVIPPVAPVAPVIPPVAPVAPVIPPVAPVAPVIPPVENVPSRPPAVVPTPTAPEQVQLKENPKEKRNTIALMGGSIIARIALDHVIRKATTKMAAKGAFKTLTPFKSVVKRIAKLSAEALKKLTLKASGKLMAKTVATAAGKEAVRASSKVLALGPVGIAMIGFDLVSAGLDMADVGGYVGMKSKETYLQIRDETDKSFVDIVHSEGGEYPLTYGPLDWKDTNDPDGMQADIKAETEKIIADPNHPLMQNYYTAVNAWAKANPDATEDDLNAYLDKAMEENVNDDSLLQAALSALCIKYGGKEVKNNVCTYATREGCRKSMPDVIPHAANTPEDFTYVEWDAENDVCAMRPKTVHDQCVDAGMEWNWYKRSCDVTEAYCKTKGAEWKFNPKIGENDCNIPTGQKILEFMFGTTVTRGLKQVFDPDQYCECPSPVKNLGVPLNPAGKLTEEATKLIFDSANMNDPASAAVKKMAELSSMKIPIPLCAGCPPGYKQSGAFCYPKCEPGYKDVLSGCWRCPEGWSNFGLTCPKPTKPLIKEDIIKASPDYANVSVISKVVPPMSQKKNLFKGCPGGWKNFGFACLKCPDGYDSNLPFCTRGCPPGWTNLGAICEKCPDGYTNYGVKCKKCPPGYKDLGPLGCGKCNGDLTNLGVVCTGCPPGYKNIGVGCLADCPPGYKDLGLSCSSGYDRTKDLKMMKIKPKVRKYEYSKKKGNSNTTADCGGAYKDVFELNY